MTLGEKLRREACRLAIEINGGDYSSLPLPQRDRLIALSFFLLQSAEAARSQQPSITKGKRPLPWLKGWIPPS